MVSNRISKLDFIRILQEKNIIFFHINDLKKIFPLKSTNTIKHLLSRLKKETIVESLTKGKYLFLQSRKPVSDFETANFLVIPSYVSLESALTLYGIIEQFPYAVTSITLQKTQEIKIKNKLFKYSKINKKYFKDFISKDNFVIATKEKALFDYFYFIYKGQKSIMKIEELKNHLDLNIKKYFKANAENNFLSFLKKNVKL